MGKAKQYFEVAAENGSQGSNYYLGKIYYNGNGVQTNHLKAKEYFEKSFYFGSKFSQLSIEGKNLTNLENRIDIQQVHS